VSSPTVISEQEVEVAEALFDLARMFNQSTPVKVNEMIDTNSEPKAASKSKTESAAKPEGSASGDNIVAYPTHPLPSSRSVPTSTAATLPTVSLQTSPLSLATSPCSLLSSGIASVHVPAESILPVTALTTTSVPPVTAAPAEGNACSPWIGGCFSRMS
jgi:hypothetical protein